MCEEGEKQCVPTSAQLSNNQDLDTKDCPVDESFDKCPDQFVTSTEFVQDGFYTSGVFDSTKEGGTEIDLDLQGGCGSKVVGTEATRITYVMQVTDDGEISQEDVIDYLHDNVGQEAFCGADEAPAAGSASEQQETIFIAPTSRNGGRKLEESLVTGFVPCDKAFFLRNDLGGCGENCHFYQGCADVYCKYGTSKPQCFSDGVNVLQKNAGKATNPPLITSVEVVGTIMDADSAGNGAGDIASIIGLETNEGENEGLTTAGAGLIIGFSVLAALVVLLAVRKNRKAYTRDISFLDMEDMCSVDGDNIHLKPGDSSFDGTEIMSEGGTPSPAGSKWRKTRPGHVVDEDDSVLSGNNRQIVPRELVYGGALVPSDLDRQHSGVDVHQCNSAMCEICLARGVNPRFVPAHLEDSYHVEGDDRLNASDLSYGSRNYPMEDTVDF